MPDTYLDESQRNTVFESTKDLITAYRGGLAAAGTPYISAAADELYIRMDQLNFLLAEIHGLEVLFDSVHPSVWFMQRTGEMMHNSFKLGLHTETFYYFAFRIRQMLQYKPKDKPHQLPGLESFQCDGVRQVRNHLIEHPEKPRGIMANGMTSGIPEGPKLKLSLGGDGFSDPGLWVNVAEYKRNLERVLIAATPPP